MCQWWVYALNQGLLVIYNSILDTRGKKKNTGIKFILVIQTGIKWHAPMPPNQPKMRWTGGAYAHTKIYT